MYIDDLPIYGPVGSLFEAQDPNFAGGEMVEVKEDPSIFVHQK